MTAHSLESSTSRARSHRLRGAGGVELHALHWGEPDAPLAVLLHGGGANAHWWDHLAPDLLSAVPLSLWALDFRGHGDSDHPEERVVGAFNEDLEALLQHLGTGRVFLIGASMGGGVALDHSAQHAETRGCVLIDVSRGGERRSRRAVRLALASRRSYASREDAIDRFRFLPAAERAPESLRRAIATHSVCEQPDGRWGYKFDPRWFGLPPRPRPDPSAIRCPVLVIRGAESGLLTRAGAEAWCREIPGARCVEIEGAGHHVPLDRPAEVASAIGAFLSEILRTETRAS